MPNATVQYNFTKFNLIIFVTICFSILAFSKKTMATPGACIVDPNASKLQEKWNRYHELMKKKANVNKSTLVNKIKMDLDTLALINSVSESETLIQLFDKLESQYLGKAFLDKRFNEMISHPDFMTKLIKKEIDAEIRNSELGFKDDPQFFDLLEEIRLEIAKPEIASAIDLFRNYDLGILEKKYRSSAKAALKIIRTKGGDNNTVRSWKDDPPYLRNVALPPASLGPFAVRYRILVSKSIAQYILNTPIELNDARKIYKKIKLAEQEEINNTTPPTEANSFDDHIATLSNTEDAAIDGVARTLWGEASSCEIQGLPQFDAIGRIIADRSLAVKRSMAELKDIEQKSNLVRENNWAKVLKNWVGLAKPSLALENKPNRKLMGLGDFGRKENLNLHPSSQVISKKGQFSVWNSYSRIRYKTGTLHKNIPNVMYEIKGPQSENDDQALVRILCPQFQNEKQKELWQKALLISEQIVKTPEELANKIKWPKYNSILFYTHDADLPFAQEVIIKDLIIDGQKRPLRKNGSGPCNQFKLFIPKNNSQY